MKSALKILLLLSMFSTAAAQNSAPREIKATEELRYRLQYQQTLEALPKLPLYAAFDTTLPTSEFPYTDFVNANEAFYRQYLLAIRWITGSPAHELTCKSQSVVMGATQSFTESSNAAALREERSLKIGQDGLRNFDISEFIASVPGYKNCGLTEAEGAAIYDYTNSIYRNLNAALRSRSVDPDLEAFATTLDHALDKLANFNGVVRRGTSLAPEARAKYFAGATVLEPAYTSTSIKKQFQGDDQFEIQSATGKYIAPLSANHSEEEVLFRRGTKFKVLKVETDSDDPQIQHYHLIEQAPLELF